jgi:hypothetical protein
MEGYTVYIAGVGLEALAIVSLRARGRTDAISEVADKVLTQSSSSFSCPHLCHD